MDTTHIFQSTNPDTCWDNLHTIIQTTANSPCPVRKHGIPINTPPWPTKELIKLLRDRDYLCRKTRKQNNRDTWDLAKAVKNRPFQVIFNAFQGNFLLFPIICDPININPRSLSVILFNTVTVDKCLGQVFIFPTIQEGLTTNTNIPIKITCLHNIRLFR